MIVGESQFRQTVIYPLSENSRNQALGGLCKYLSERACSAKVFYALLIKKKKRKNRYNDDQIVGDLLTIFWDVV